MCLCVIQVTSNAGNFISLFYTVRSVLARLFLLLLVSWFYFFLFVLRIFLCLVNVSCPNGFDSLQVSCHLIFSSDPYLFWVLATTLVVFSLLSTSQNRSIIEWDVWIKNFLTSWFFLCQLQECFLVQWKCSRWWLPLPWSRYWSFLVNFFAVRTILSFSSSVRWPFILAKQSVYGTLSILRFTHILDFQFFTDCLC